MSTLILTRGLPASGKTTWAKAWVAEAPEDEKRARLNRDDLRSMIWGGWSEDYSREDHVTAIQRAGALSLLGAGYDVVLDDTNLRMKFTREWRRWAIAHGHDFRVKDFPVAVEEAIKRDAARETPVGEEVIRRMSKFLRGEALAPIPDEEEPPPPAKYHRPFGKPVAAIVDIDGTVALMNGRGPYELHNVHFDLTNIYVVSMVRMMRNAGVQIIWCSGREESCRFDTELWLRDRCGRTPDEPLFMRATEDKRRDSIVKLEIFDREIRDHYDVRYVLDDRNQVVAMWRSLGLTVFQVADGDF